MTADAIHAVPTLAAAVLDDAGYDADRYAGIAAERVDSIKLPPLLPPDFDRLLSTVAGLRKSDRFQSLAMSTVLTRLDLGQLDTERLGLLYKLHGLLALNLNCSGIAYEASLTAVRYLPQSRGQEIAECYSQAATAARNERRFPEALSLFTKARDLALASARPVLAAWQWFRLGKMYVNYLQQPSRGFTYVSLADAEFQVHREQIGARKGHAACLDELGDFYRETAGDTATAGQLYKGAASLNREIGNRSGLARNLAHLGLCAVAEGHLSNARDLLQESLDVLRTCPGEARGVGLRLGQYARVCIALGEEAAAAVALAEATSLAEQYRDANTLAKQELVWALLRRQQGEPLRAKGHLTRAVDVSRERGLYAVGAAAHEMLASLARDEFNDYESAKSHLQESINARVEAWEDVSRGNPKLEEVEDAREIGRMYKSLFERLLEQYKHDLSASTVSAQAAYAAALRERDDRFTALSNLFRFGALTAAVGHEVLNNLGNSLSNLRRLARRADPDDARLLDSLRGGLTSSAALLQGQAVREFVLRGADLRGSQETQNASSTLAAIVADFVRDGGERGVTVTSTGVDDVGGLLVNRMLARIILRNVFDNALEVVRGPQARISIEVERRPEHHVAVTCQDNGPGMTPEHLEAAFTLGHSTKAGHSGAGLPIVHFLLESVGGAVTASSVPGTGTSITVLLPCKPVDPYVSSPPC